MKSTQKLTLEVKKLNEKLDAIGSRSRFLVYSANPFKFFWLNFLAGIAHSLGSLFGTAVIAAVVVYFFSQINLIGYFSGFLNSVFTQLDWNNLLFPTPSP